MPIPLLYSSLIILCSILSFTILIKSFTKNQPKKLPPGPPKLPFIGNLHQLVASKTTLPHRRLAELARVYGPIMHLKLGEISTVVISSPETAKNVMKPYDSVLCSRPKMMLGKVVFYDCSDIALSPYGEYWRQVRKIASLQLFTAHRVHSFRPVQEEEVLDFVKSLVLPAKEGSVVNLSDLIFSLNFNIILRIAVNKKGKDGKEFKQLLKDMGESVSGFSVCDLYPSLSFISTISGMNRKLQKIVMRIDRLMDPIIEDHKSTKRHFNDQQDLVDVLLKFHKHDHDQLHGNDFNLTSNNIKAIVLELFGAASDTTSTTIEWAFSELLKNPKAMKRAQEEVRQAFQGTQKMVDEASLHKLEYLKCVIKETLRLHPAFPCLLPRESMERCEIEGYEIPPQTRIFINAWAIGRDSRYWEDPEKFIPERFESSLVDYKGNYFELIPFGSGRRICPGMGLGIATIELALAMLLYHFDWELPNGCKPQDMDMDEALGIVGRRKNDLYVIPSLYFHSDFM